MRHPGVIFRRRHGHVHGELRYLKWMRTRRRIDDGPAFQVSVPLEHVQGPAYGEGRFGLPFQSLRKMQAFSERTQIKAVQLESAVRLGVRRQEPVEGKRA